MNGQLTLDLDAAIRDRDDLHARIREAVTEPGMTPAEIDAAVRDALPHVAHVRDVAEATTARPCICDHPLLFVAELGEGSCGLCGREPAR